MRFSWSLTTMMHRFPGASEYDRRMQDTDLAQLERSGTAQKLMAENYTGLPY
jgi:p-hydroxybenzoate 3-monooxygenase